MIYSRLMAVSQKLLALSGVQPTQNCLNRQTTVRYADCKFLPPPFRSRMIRRV